MARERPIDGALSSLDARERQITVVFDYIDVISEEYGLHPERHVKLS